MSLRNSFDKNIRRLEKPFKTYNEIQINSQALLSNFDLLQSLIPAGNVFPVLKSNAYGHGIHEVATILKQRKFPYIAVDGFYERLEIGKVSKQSVLVMGSIHPENFKSMSFKRTAFLVHDEATIKALGNTKRSVAIHLELETGMTRHGVVTNELEQCLKVIKKYPNLHLEGVMSHLADADNPNDDEYTKQQTELFDQSVGHILQAGFKPIYFHIAQSAGSSKVASRYANTIRPGIALYGISPLEPNDKSYKIFKNLKPVLNLRSVITKVLTVSKGTTVSYNRTYSAKEDTKIGVLPMGYYEGVKRIFSNTGLVEYGGAYLPIAGRVNMNHTMVDLKASGCQAGEAVTIISDNPSSKVSIENICKRHDTLNAWEILALLSPNIRRTVINKKSS
jgi:alanine racemase